LRVASAGWAGNPAAGTVASVLTVGDTAPRYSRRNPYRAEILESILLSGRDSGKETRHLELAIEGGELPFRPGDSLGVVAENEDSIVEAVVEALDLLAGEPVTVNGQAKILADALRADLELTRLTPSFLRSWADAAGAVELAGLVSDGRNDTLRRFMACNQVLDVIERYPVRRLAPQEFVGMLRRLQPRLYSIASSPAWLPGQIDLTVAVTRTTADGKLRNGVASTFLAERRNPGQAVDVYVQPHRTFRLPADPASPVIMIGAGAGVAPFRAFLQDREGTGATGRTWLFFGERTFREDFLYQTEWQRFLRTGVLTRMDVAFSRDQERKIYVQHRVRERVLDVWAWLEEGAHVYVCGDAAGMAPAVHEALVAVAREGGSLSRDAAEAYVEALRAQGRYERDVY
jgi:sulfite reductase (NADPH) flavoprotein alpha-component